ncbi:MAG: hypothetical protein EA424_11380 [Planctomycetaceae bacterium]|nr:MAG: hypothetical protein EA424_11380 [Planctomycetaceae bacterium]
MALEAVLENILEEAIMLESYQKVLLPLDTTPESVRIRWNNLWIRPTDNLKTVHPLTHAWISSLTLRFTNHRG